jgi:hypothetical protein
MLVRDSPPALDFAQADGQTEAVLGILLQLLSGPATKQCVCKGDIVPGDDIERDDLERGTLFLPIEKGRPCVAIGRLTRTSFGGGTSNITMSSV